MAITTSDPSPSFGPLLPHAMSRQIHSASAWTADTHMASCRHTCLTSTGEVGATVYIAYQCIGTPYKVSCIWWGAFQTSAKATLSFIIFSFLCSMVVTKSCARQNETHRHPQDILFLYYTLMSFFSFKQARRRIWNKFLSKPTQLIEGLDVENHGSISERLNLRSIKKTHDQSCTCNDFS